MVLSACLVSTDPRVRRTSTAITAGACYILIKRKLKGCAGFAENGGWVNMAGISSFSHREIGINLIGDEFSQVCNETVTR